MPPRFRQALAGLTALACAACATEPIRPDAAAGDAALKEAFLCTKAYVRKVARGPDSAEAIADAAYAACGQHWIAYSDASCAGSNPNCPQIRAAMRPKTAETARKHILALIVEERAR